MSTFETWRQKLDPHGRMRVEEGIPIEGVDVTVRLTSKDAQWALELAAQGLQMHSQVDEIIVGHVANEVDLKHVAELNCVQELHISQRLYADRSNASE